MRYPVQNLLELLASGMTDAEILAVHKDLEADDLRACQAYAAEILRVLARPLIAGKGYNPTDYSMNGKTAEQWEAGRIAGLFTSRELREYLEKHGKLPPDTRLDQPTA
jgi:hypothetical protein